MVRLNVGVASRRAREGQAGKVEASVEEGALCVDVARGGCSRSAHVPPSDESVLAPEMVRLTLDPAQANPA